MDTEEKLVMTVPEAGKKLGLSRGLLSGGEARRNSHAPDRTPLEGARDPVQPDARRR